MGWKEVSSEATMTMEADSANIDVNATKTSEEAQNSPLFIREIKGVQVGERDTDHYSLQEGCITISALSGLTRTESDCEAYLKEWLPCVAERFSSPAL